MIDKLCKVGDIYITAAGTAGVIFDQSSPYQLATKLQKIASEARADLYYPNELRPGGADEDASDAASTFADAGESGDPFSCANTSQNAPLPSSNDKSHDA